MILSSLLLLLSTVGVWLSASTLAGADAAIGAAGVPMYPVLCDSASQGCIRQPPGCRSVQWSGSSGLACEYLAAWRRAADRTGDLELSVAGRVALDGGYIGIGFKPGRGGAGHGVALICYKSPADSTVHMRLVSTDASLKFFQAAEADDARLLGEADSAPLFAADRPERAAYFSPLNDKAYATLECRARLRVNKHPLLEWLRQPEAPAHPVGLLRPDGRPVKSDGLEKPQWRYTAPARPLDESGDSVGPASTGGAKAHGCLMVLAWILCASVGMLLARYYKLQWPARLLGKELAWFQLHRALMACCCILTLLSFIVIFADVAGYSQLDNLPDIVHPILGIIVAILTLVNPLMSLCRCAPDHDKRPWFNWIHWIVGTVAYILAIVNVFLGLRLERAGALRSIDYHIWILILFVLIQFVVEIVLEIHTLVYWRRNKMRWRQYQQDMLDYQQHVRQKDAGSLQKPEARPVEPRPIGYCLRAFLLALHAIIATATAKIGRAHV